MKSNATAGEGIVGFRLPGNTPVWWRGSIVEAGGDVDGFIVAPFDTSEPTLVLTPTWTSYEAPKTWPLLTTYVATAEDDKYTYKQKVAQALSHIATGELQKIVISRATTDNISVDPIAFFTALTNKYPTAFVYLLYTPQYGCWVGATPETLLAFRGDRWHTQSLAGTLPFPPTRDWSEKEYHEQQMVTDTIVASLREANIVPEVDERRTIAAGAIQHLSTTITHVAPFDKAMALALAAKLHPTPAVCGLPKSAALAAITAMEARDRSLYAGYLGPIQSADFTQLFVNLRCCQIWKDAVTLHVGGGIVAGSEPEAEWEETANKAQTLRSVLQTVVQQ